MWNFKLITGKMNILITGAPGVGKTTFIQKLSEELQDFFPNGFFTEEIREKGRRQGFQIETFGGKRRVFAHTSINSPHRVSRYRVNVAALDEIIQDLSSEKRDIGIWLIDEIGKMESFSPTFRNFIESILNSLGPVVATISLSAGGWIKAIRERTDAQLIELTVQNRDNMLDRIVPFIRKNVQI